MKKLTSLIYCTGVIALYGCSSSSENKTVASTTATAQKNEQISEAVKTLHPEFSVSDSNSLCETSNDTPLIGCYVSEVCAVDDTDSRLYVTDIRSTGMISSALYYYQESMVCSGTPIVIGLSALDYNYEIGGETLSQSGLSVTEFDPSLEVDLGQSSFITNYFSSFYLDDGRLCLPERDYSWGSSGGGLVFNEKIAANRPTNIDFDNCLEKIR